MKIKYNDGVSLKIPPKLQTVENEATGNFSTKDRSLDIIKNLHTKIG